jgi:hypothetical protein
MDSDEPGSQIIELGRGQELRFSQLPFEDRRQRAIVVEGEGQVFRHGVGPSLEFCGPPTSISTSRSLSPSTRNASRVPGGAACPSASGRARKRLGSRTDALTDTRSRVAMAGVAGDNGGREAAGGVGRVEAREGAAADPSPEGGLVEVLTLGGGGVGGLEPPGR